MVRVAFVANLIFVSARNSMSFFPVAAVPAVPAPAPTAEPIAAPFPPPAIAPIIAPAAAPPPMPTASRFAFELSVRPHKWAETGKVFPFTTMESMFEERAPLHRHIESADVGAAAAYLLSDDAKNVTGTTLYVDAGYHSMGM